MGLKHFAIFCILFLMPCLCIGQSRHALLIGIGDYPQGSGWNTIHGDNDISIIKTLLIKQGFVEDNIMVLKNTEATKSGILAAMDQLLENPLESDPIVVLIIDPPPSFISSKKQKQAEVTKKHSSLLSIQVFPFS